MVAFAWYLDLNLLAYLITVTKKKSEINLISIKSVQKIVFFLFLDIKKYLLYWSLAIISFAVGKASESPTEFEALTAKPYSCPTSRSVTSYTLPVVEP